MAVRNEPKQTNMKDEDHRGVPCSKVRVLCLRRPKPSSLSEESGAIVVNVTSHSKETWTRDLSPFFLGPVELYDGRKAQVMENGWQFTKVYASYATKTNTTTADKGEEIFQPNEQYWKWAEAGWKSTKAQRFPMGRGVKPLYSLWKGEHLGYIEARKKIYAPLYSQAVQITVGFEKLKKLYSEAMSKNKPLVLLDFDGWDHIGQGYKLEEVIEQHKPIMGHAFILAGLLENNLFWLPQSQQLTTSQQSMAPHP